MTVRMAVFLRIALGTAIWTASIAGCRGKGSAARSDSVAGAVPRAHDNAASSASATTRAENRYHAASTRAANTPYASIYAQTDIQFAHALFLKPDSHAASGPAFDL